MYVEFDLLVFARGSALSFLSSLPCFSNMTWPWQSIGGVQDRIFPDRHPQMIWDDELQGLVTSIFPRTHTPPLLLTALTSFLLVAFVPVKMGEEMKTVQLENNETLKR